MVWTTVADIISTARYHCCQITAVTVPQIRFWHVSRSKCHFDFDFDFGHILLVSSCVNSFSIQISVTFCWFPAALGLKMILIITIKMIMIFNNNTIVNNNNSNNSNTNNSISSNSGKGGLEHGKVRARHVTWRDTWHVLYGVWCMCVWRLNYDLRHTNIWYMPIQRHVSWARFRKGWRG